MHIEFLLGILDDQSTEKFIFPQTKKKGVDIIVTTQPSEVLQSSLHSILKCLTEGGKFIVVGTSELLKMPPINLNKNYSFHNVLPQTILNAVNELKQEIHGFVTQGMYCWSYLVSTTGPTIIQFVSYTYVNFTFEFVENIDKF